MLVIPHQIILLINNGHNHVRLIIIISDIPYHPLILTQEDQHH